VLIQEARQIESYWRVAHNLPPLSASPPLGMLSSPAGPGRRDGSSVIRVGPRDRVSRERAGRLSRTTLDRGRAAVNERVLGKDLTRKALG
jgi:hypothetical protein